MLTVNNKKKIKKSKKILKILKKKKVKNEKIQKNNKKIKFKKRVARANAPEEKQTLHKEVKAVLKINKNVALPHIIMLTEENIQKAKFQNKSFLNFAGVELTEDQQQLLDEGLKFVPFSKELACPKQFEESCQQMLNSVCRPLQRIFLRNPAAEIEVHTKHRKLLAHKVINKTGPTFEKRGKSRIWNRCFRKIQMKIKRSQKTFARYIKINKFQSNISESQALLIQQLQKSRNLVIKKVDKGSNLAVMSKEQYLTIGFDHLNSPETYEPYEDPEKIEKLVTEIETTLDLLVESGEIKPNARAFLSPVGNKLTSLASMYFLPKTHKQGKLKGRPIVSGCAYPTANLSAFADLFLQPIVLNQKSFLKDTGHLLSTISNFSTDQKIILASWDVVSMYTVVPHDEALKIISEEFEKQYISVDNFTKKEVVLKFIKMVLEENYFEFNGRTFKQRIGAAMGSKASPAICDVVFGAMEDQITELGGQNLKIWKRFRDDVFLVWTGTEEQYIDFAEKANKISKIFQFTQEHSEKEIQMLDLTIMVDPTNPGKLASKIYFKPTNLFQFIRPHSLHKKTVFKGIVKGELLRCARNSSSLNHFLEAAQFLKQKWIQRGYQAKMIEETIRPYIVDYQFTRAQLLNKIREHKGWDIYGIYKTNLKELQRQKEDQPNPIRIISKGDPVSLNLQNNIKNLILKELKNLSDDKVAIQSITTNYDSIGKLIVRAKCQKSKHWEAENQKVLKKLQSTT